MLTAKKRNFQTRMTGTQPKMNPRSLESQQNYRRKISNDHSFAYRNMSTSFPKDLTTIYCFLMNLKDSDRLKSDRQLGRKPRSSGIAKSGGTSAVKIRSLSVHEKLYAKGANV